MKLQIIVGSVRKNSQGSQVGKWIANVAEQAKSIEAELLDLHDWPLPLYNEAMPPLMMGGKYESEIGTKWAAKISEADAFVFITPEYNHGYSAAIKNAIDWVGNWSGKPAAIVGYSMTPNGGVLGVEQLKPILTQMGLLQVGHNVLVRAVHEAFDESGGPKDHGYDESLQKVLTSLTELNRKLASQV